MIGGQSLGYQQVVGIAAAANLPNVPKDATSAMILIEGQDVRWRDDGTDPTTTVGMLLSAGTEMTYQGDIAKVRIIEVTASATLNVIYYR